MGTYCQPGRLLAFQVHLTYQSSQDSPVSAFGTFACVLCSAAIICSVVCFGSEPFFGLSLIYLFLVEGQLQCWFLPGSELFCF